MSFTTTVKTVANANPKKTMEVVATIDIKRVFTGHGFLPAVVATGDVVGEWPSAGANRKVVFSDGSKARERITSFDFPFFVHTIKFESGPYSQAVDHIDGFWSFYGISDGATSIRWEYTFFPRSLAVIPLLWFITTFFWPEYM